MMPRSMRRAALGMASGPRIVLAPGGSSSITYPPHDSVVVMGSVHSSVTFSVLSSTSGVLMTCIPSSICVGLERSPKPLVMGS